MADVMISYASVDRPTASLLADRLGADGFDVWFDRDIPAGRDFSSVIEAELGRSKAVVVLWSPASVDSRWVVAEAAEAASQGKLVPAMVDDATIPLEFRRVQAADLAGWRGDPRHSGYRKLVKALRGQPPASPRSKPRRKQSKKKSERHSLPSRVLSWLFVGVGFAVFAGWALDQCEFPPPDNGPETTIGEPATNAASNGDYPGLFDPVNLSAPFDNSSYPFGERGGEPDQFAEEIMNEWLRTSGCGGDSRGEIVSISGGNPAVAIVDLSVPCMDRDGTLFPFSGGFRLEIKMAGDENNVWTVTGLRMQVFCPRGVTQGALCQQ